MRFAAVAGAVASLATVVALRPPAAFFGSFRATTCQQRERPKAARKAASPAAIVVSPPPGKGGRTAGLPGSGRSRDEYVFDMDYAIGEAELLQPKTPGLIKYFGAGVPEGLSILVLPDGEAVDRLMPGDVVAAEVADDGSHARLLDGRGWLTLASEGLEEVHPWAARVMKKPGIDKNDVAALAYLNLDDDGLSPLATHLPLPQRVVKELQRRGIAKASPIQEAVFSRVHRGESMCLQSQTGSGKTLAMMLPLLTAMSEESEWGHDGDKIVVVTSCRELAVQLFSDIDNMGFFPEDQGFATLVIVGNVPPTSAVLRANVIIGTPNELGGMLHKDRDIIEQMNTKLRGIVMDEVDEYTTAPRIYSSKWNIKQKRKIYNEKKMTLNGKLGDFDYGRIEWFVKRTLAYSRRKDLQVLAASATLSRNMARKVFRLLRWDPLGRWYRKPPPLLRPLATAKVDWQATPRMPTVPLHVQHRYVQVVKGRTDISITSRHWTRKPVDKGGMPRIKVRAAAGQRRGTGARPVSSAMAASLLDGLHDALKIRKSGSAMLIICRTVGLTVRDTVAQLHKWGFYEAEAMHSALWEDPKDWPSRWAIKYTYDQVDHSSELATRHRALNERLRSGKSALLPVASPAWRRMEERKAAGETVTPLIVGFEGVGRGLHFDGVETVYILGLPRKPEVYLHLAGRVGRLGHRGGKVISVLPKRGSKVLDAWAAQVGPGVQFQAEPIERIRSAPALTPAKTPGERRQLKRRRPPGHGPWARRREDEEDEWRSAAKLETKEPMLLPAEKDYLRIPGEEEEDVGEEEGEEEDAYSEKERELVAREARERRAVDLVARGTRRKRLDRASFLPGRPILP